MQSPISDLIERVRRRLNEVDQRCLLAGPVSEEVVAAAEEKLNFPFPPSYREFLLKFGALALPSELAVVHDFIGIEPPPGGDGGGRGVVERTLAARVENRLSSNLVVVGLGAQANEWYCLDSGRHRPGGELPIVLFDARDNQLDQVFYDDFDAMLREVLEFVEDTLSHEQTSVA